MVITSIKVDQLFRPLLSYQIGEILKNKSYTVDSTTYKDRLKFIVMVEGKKFTKSIKSDFKTNEHVRYIGLELGKFVNRIKNQLDKMDKI